MGLPPQFTLPGTAYTRCVSVIPQGGTGRLRLRGSGPPRRAQRDPRGRGQVCPFNALGSILKGSMGCIPVGYALARRATTMHCTGKHHSLPQPPPAGSLANSNIDSLPPISIRLEDQLGHRSFNFLGRFNTTISRLHLRA